MTEYLSAYGIALGSNINKLDPSVRHVHAYNGEASMLGQVNVKRGNGRLALFVGRLLKLPPPLSEAEAKIVFKTTGYSEVLTREYGPDRNGQIWIMQSDIEADPAAPMMIHESFGHAKLTLQLHTNHGKLAHEITGVTLFGVPLPKFCWPELCATEWQENGRYRFDVCLSLPLAGFIIRYSGWLLPA